MAFIDAFADAIGEAASGLIPRTANFPNSTALASATYSGGELVIIFVGGNAATYSGVPLSVWEGLISAPSAGQYYNSVIKAGSDDSHPRL
jgi:hypothetical protein